MADQPSYKPLEAAISSRMAVPRGRQLPARWRAGTCSSIRRSSPGVQFAAAASSNTDTATTPKREPIRSRRHTPRRRRRHLGAFVEKATLRQKFPIPVSEAVLTHGYNRYMIYCVVCHDPLAPGKEGSSSVATPRLHRSTSIASANAPVGRLCDCHRRYGSMPSYAAQIPPADRWAIVAYVRALQLSQHFPARS